MKSILVDLPGDATEEMILDHNADPEVHGVLVQVPLPKYVNEERILSAIRIEKDVDGFHPSNIGKLCIKRREPIFVPCTPKGCIELLLRTGIPIAGKRAVVVGRSNIVGLPVAMFVATVSIVHSNTADPKSIVKEVDIVIAAAGQTQMIKGDWIKPGAVVIDVGTNYINDLNKKMGHRLVGDVDFAEAKKVADWITPVPGGVGPSTIAMLLKNTLEAAKQAFVQPENAANV